MKTESEKNRYIFEEMPVIGALSSMAIPTVISQLIILIYNMADTFFIGRINDPVLVASVALILPIFNVTIAFANIAGTGGGTLIARLLGVKQINEARKVAAFSFYFSGVAALFFSIITAVFIRPLLEMLGASDLTFEHARQYTICVIVFGAFPTILSMTMSNLLRNVGCSKQAGIGVSAGGIINIVLDPLFMFVFLPPGNEILGAGIATALSNYIVCAYFILVIKNLKSDVLNFSPNVGLPIKENIASFFSVGIPAAIGPFLFDLDYIVIDRLTASYSDIALASIGIVLKVERFPLNIGIGLCLGMVPLAAYNFSSGNIKRMRAFLETTRTIGIVVGLISILFYEIFSVQIIRIFIADQDTVFLGSEFLRIRAIATIMMFLCFIYVHFFQAIGYGKHALFLAVFRWLCINIPMLFILNSIIGLYGIIWSQFVSDTFVAIISYLIYYKFKRKCVITELGAV